PPTPCKTATKSGSRSRASWGKIGPLRRRDFVAWAGERRSPYREYGQAFRRTQDTKDPGPSGCVAAGAHGVAALDRIADTPFARLLVVRLATTQRSCPNLAP